MTEDDLMTLLHTKTGRHVLDTLAEIPQAERRKHAKAVVKHFRDLQGLSFVYDRNSRPKLRDEEAVTVGLLATATLTDLKRLGYLPYLKTVSLVDLVSKLKPDWTQALVDHLVESNPYLVSQVAPLWKAGLCQRPEGDAIILGYFGHFRGDGEDEADLLDRDVWRFFEVEGGGEFSLANHDKYAKPGTDSWEARLVGYANSGKLDRQRLLDASLDALERDFAQYRAGWFSRFHVAMAPTPGEMAARAPRYLGLLGSSVPPTVSFAMKIVQALDKAEALAPGDLLAALEPALQARSKGTVAAALKLVARAAKRDASLTPDAASRALLALVCEDAGVQGKALDLFEALAGPDDPALCDMLADYVELVAPSVRPRIAALARVAPAEAPAPAEPEAPPAPVAVVPVDSADAALSLYLSVLETPRDPFEVERAVDGLSRFGPELRAEDQRLSPLRKRAKQIWSNPGDSDLRLVLALTASVIAEGTSLGAPGDADQASPLPFFEGWLTLQRVHFRRNVELANRVLSGCGLPLLSLPSDSSGTVSVADLTDRLALYRAAETSAGPVDMSLALMRLDTAGQGADAAPAPLPVPVPDADIDTEANRALAYALGADVPVGPTAELWASAWCARQTQEQDPRIVALFDTPLPNCGIPVRQSLNVRREDSRDGPYFWVKVEVPASPEMPNQADVLPAIYAHHPMPTRYVPWACGGTFADIAWASLTRPTDPEPFYRQGILQQDTWQKLTDNPTRAFLEPFFRPGGPVGELGAGLLAHDMACEDKSVSSLAAEAAALVLRQNRLSEERLATALKAFLMSQSLPTSRWTKALATMAEAGAECHVREIIAQLLDFPPDDTPSDMGGMIELFYELHMAAGTAPTRPETLACLGAIKGGGKVAKFSKKLRALASQAA
ncbi:MAG: DUF6493 family protein [Pseudomonadota bacterium]